MKIICAGFPKTGTKTIAEALRILGYKVHDAEEQFHFLGPDMVKIIEEGGTTEDFRRIYRDVEAVTDIPSSVFWQELHSAFPDAKIILTRRENEDVWWRSWENQIKVGMKHPLLMMLINLSPTGRRFRNYHQMLLQTFFSSKSFRPWAKKLLNEMICKMRYRQHNHSVIASAPKDKLLVQEVAEGWGALCKFLDVPVPEQEFPHKNKNGAVIKEMISNSPTFVQIKRELKIAISMLVLVLFAVVLKMLI